ncbi:LptF/LptG family permease [Helicobacter sp. MIT 14-3879]|uniref:LptF/LptG family permease n=1 Tax=Helicobacter sp. MIT 14-3879 TaxID=2040649 RepID=UPI000E1F5ACF|nr:LptF/LptG family permease [Helicobacter sp. MIT 14-3879]RDU62282.1 permease [Helicobacter sp. MIT 14-3879]
MLFRFLGWIYIKFILLIFIALQLFFMGIDILKHSDNLPDSANLFVLFLMYDFLYALNYTFPISIILAPIVCYIVLLKSNQLTAIFSIGYSRRQALMPLLVISILLNLFYISLNATSFAYSEENIENIVKRGGINDAKSNLFVKYNNNYIYMEKIFPLLQKAQNIKVFEINNFTLAKFIEAKEASFDGTWWNLKSATITTIPKSPNFEDSKLLIQNISNYKILKDFKPKILDTIYQNKPNISIIDAINTLFLLQEQDGNTQKIRSILYSFIAIPIAIPFTIIIMYFYVPSLARYTNLAKLGFVFVLLCLIVWGVFFMLTKLSISGFLIPEFGVIIPLCIFIFTSLYFYKKL